MGQKPKRKARFLTDHPICCFCGGQTPATTEDHVPGRAFFDLRQWPEGHVFPACKNCNDATKHDEQVVALLSRVYTDEDTPEHQVAIEKLLKGVGNNYFDVLLEMNPSARMVRSALKRYNKERSPGLVTTEMPYLNVSGPLVTSALNRFGRKLFLALYYKHTGKILARSGGIAILHKTNLQMEAGEIPEQFASILSVFPPLERAKQDLSNQFFYRYRLVEESNGGVFLAIFRQSFGMLGFVFENGSIFPDIATAETFGPFDHG